jgi:hypothetical protein
MIKIISITKSIESKQGFLASLKLILNKNLAGYRPSIEVDSNRLKISFDGSFAPIVFQGTFDVNCKQLAGSFRLSVLTFVANFILIVGSIFTMILSWVKVIDMQRVELLYLLFIASTAFFLWDVTTWKRRAIRVRDLMLLS